MNEEIKVLGTKIIVSPYLENPYMEIQSKCGLDLKMDSHTSNESGMVEKNAIYTQCAKVIAIGDMCKNIKVGDDIFFNVGISSLLPYFGLDYRVIYLDNILAVVNK